MMRELSTYPMLQRQSWILLNMEQRELRCKPSVSDPVENITQTSASQPHPVLEAGMYIQLGAFSKKQNAVSMENKVKRHYSGCCCSCNSIS